MISRWISVVIYIFTLNLLYWFAGFVSADTQKIYTVAINKTSFPYHFVDANGQAAGLTVDMWKLWAQKQGVEVDFKAMSWQQTLDLVAQGEVDIHAGLAKTPSRSQIYLYTQPFFYQNSYFYVHRDYNQVNSIENLAPLTLGIVAGSSHIDVVAKLFPQLTIKTYPNRFAIFDGALAGEIAVFANLDRLSKNYPRYRELRALFPPYKRLFFKESEYGAAVARDNRALLEFIDQGLLKITQQEKSAIEKKWLGVDKATDSLTLLYSPDMPPYMEVSNSGQAQGLLIDLWRLWSSYSGQAVDFSPQTSSDSVEILQSGGGDIHIGFEASITQDSALMAGQEVYQLPEALYLSRRYKHDTLNDLSEKKIGVIEGSPVIAQLSAQYPSMHFTPYASFSRLVSAIKSQQLDGFIAPIESINLAFNQREFEQQYYAIAEQPIMTSLNTLLLKENEKLAEIVSDGFKLIPPHELIKVEQQWLNNSDAGFFKRQETKISLTQPEQDWLAQHQEVIVGVNQQWAPVEFVDDNGQVKGINADINELVAQRTGLNFRYVAFDNWNQMLEALRKKQVDILGSATETQERKQSMLFTDSYWDMPWVVIHQRQLGEQLSVDFFYGKELAIVKGYYLISQIRERHPNISLLLVDDHEQGLEAVKKGTVEGFIENIASASELIRRESLISLKMSVIEDINVDKNSFAIRHDWPELHSILNKALTTITAAERQKIYERWFEISVETGLDKNVVLKVSLQVGAIILAIIIVIVIWNRRLYVEIQTRKSLEEQMKHMATHDELTGLANRVLLKDRLHTAISYHQRTARLMAVLFIDLDGFKNVNDNYGHDVGDELLVQVAEKLNGCVRKSDTVVRFGGDEFVLLLTGLHHKDEAGFIAEKVLKLMQQPFSLSVGQQSLGCSIGIAIYPNDGETENDLLKVADTLMYQVKAAGKNHYIFNS